VCENWRLFPRDTLTCSVIHTHTYTVSGNVRPLNLPRIWVRFSVEFPVDDTSIVKCLILKTVFVS
jgi:hypothetical protein